MGKILLVDDDIRLTTAFSYVLAQRGHTVLSAATAAEGIAVFKADSPEIVVLDIHLPDGSGLDAFRQMIGHRTSAPVIVMTGERTMQNAIEAMSMGAFSYQLKPFEPEEMLRQIERGLEDARLQKEHATHDVSNDEPVSGTIIGESAAMQEIFKSIGRVAPTDATVLIRGESGSGKELVARCIHQYSRRSSGPFVAINCLAIPEMLLESELFGHEKGSFTGADSQRIGRFEQAAGGTLFLDEIGDIPLMVQAKILRVLQERVFSRVGGQPTITANVRIISATHRYLEEAVQKQEFREDLLYRLNVVSIHLPPLRDRKVDIPVLTKTFVHRFAKEFQMPVPVVSPAALAVLMDYHWPGNVRELEHCICRALVFQRGTVLHEEHIKTALGLDHVHSESYAALPEELLLEAVRRHLKTNGGGKAFEEFTAMAETLLISESLRLASDNQTRAAKLLGLPRQTFRSKLNH